MPIEPPDLVEGARLFNITLLGNTVLSDVSEAHPEAGIKAVLRKVFTSTAAKCFSTAIFIGKKATLLRIMFNFN